MERLTVKRSDGRWALANNDGVSTLKQMEKIPLAIDRLAAYENAMPLDRAQELAHAKKDGRLVVLQEGVTVRSLQEKYRQAKRMADERLPSPDYTTGHIAGFGDGVIHILDRILTREEAEAALKKEEADNETD